MVYNVLYIDMTYLPPQPLKEKIIWPHGDPNEPRLAPDNPKIEDGRSLRSTQAAIGHPRGIERSIGNGLPVRVSGGGSAQATSSIRIEGIDDSLVVDFSLEKFNAIQFSIKKQISLFFEHTFPFFVQSLFLPIFYIAYHSIFALKIEGRENLKTIKGPVIFISNHISFYDSFMFDLFVHPFSHILPFRFMGSRVFIVPLLAVLKVIGIVDLIYFLFGVFRITPGEGAEKSLKKAYEIVKRGGTVVMYPEGRIWRPTNVHPENIGPFKWGAAILAKNTGVRVVPVSMKRTVSKERARTKIDVVIGKPFFVDSQLRPEQIAEEMRKKVVSQYENTK